MFCSRVNSFDICSDCKKKYIVTAQTNDCEDVYFCFYDYNDAEDCYLRIENHNRYYGITFIPKTAFIFRPRLMEEKNENQEK